MTNQKIEKVRTASGDVVNLRKDKFGYRVVYPIKKNTDDKFNLKNIHWVNFLFGGRNNLLNLIIILLIISSALYGFKEVTDSCRDFADNPCKYTNLNCQQPIIIGEGNSLGLHYIINVSNFTDVEN
jgi:hypothetical protein